MNAILVLVKKDFRLFFRDRASLSLTFIIPFALIYLFGQIFGVGQKTSGPKGIPLVVVSETANPAGKTLTDALKAEVAFRVITSQTGPDGKVVPLKEAEVPGFMKDNDVRFALVIPADLVSREHFGLHLKFYSNPLNEIETQTVTGLVQKTIFTNVPQLLGQSLQEVSRRHVGDERMDAFNERLANAVADTFDEDRATVLKRITSGNYGLRELGADATATPPATGTPATGTAAPAPAPTSSDVLSRIVKIDTVQVVGKDVKTPMATSLVGGWAMQFLLFALTASAAALFYEKEHGIFQRILSAPVSRAQILWSKFIYGVAIGLIQLIVLFFAGSLLFKIEFVPYLPLLIFVCIFAAAACTSCGMLLSAVSSTPEAARGLATFIILVMSAIGGAWFPVSFMPPFIQQLSRLTLVYWSMHGFEQVLWTHASLLELLPTLGILGGITAVVMTFSVWRFNTGRIFD